MRGRHPLAQAASSRDLRVFAWSALAVGIGALVVWWLADHDRGVRWAVNVVRDRYPDVPHLPPRELAAWLADGSRPPPLLLDARREEEFDVSRLRGAQRIEPGEEARATDLALHAASGRPIVVYCSAGYRGARVARRLRKAGAREVSNLEGGIFAWANEGFEVVRNGRSVYEVHPFHRIFTRLLRHDRRPQ